MSTQMKLSKTHTSFVGNRLSSGHTSGSINLPNSCRGTDSKLREWIWKEEEEEGEKMFWGVCIVSKYGLIIIYLHSIHYI